MDVTELWWLSLSIAAVIIVIVAVLLGLIIAAAKEVDRHAARIWTIGKQIAGNTVTIWVLEKTNRQVESMHNAVRDLDQSVAGINETLQALIRPDRAS